MDLSRADMFIQEPLLSKLCSFCVAAMGKGLYAAQIFLEYGAECLPRRAVSGPGLVWMRHQMPSFFFYLWDVRFFRLAKLVGLPRIAVAPLAKVVVRG
jgi:hypothetical protein